MENVTNSIIKAKGGKKFPLLLLCALALLGVLLMLLGKGGKSDGAAGSSGFENLDPAAYAKQVEEQVEELCNRVDGASGAYAVVTLRGGYRAIYASDSQSGSSSFKNETVVLGSGSSAHGLLVGYENPEIAGIGIVCRGGDNNIVRKNIVSVVSSAFDIGSNKIFVSGS